jgi:hypothetical protein
MMSCVGTSLYNRILQSSSCIADSDKEGENEGNLKIVARRSIRGVPLAKVLPGTPKYLYLRFTLSDFCHLRAT